MGFCLMGAYPLLGSYPQLRTISISDMLEYNYKKDDRPHMISIWASHILWGFTIALAIKELQPWPNTLH